MKIASIYNIWENVPVHVRAFLMRALIIFVLWKLIYHLLLFPIHFPDQQLTQLTAKSTGILYSFFIKDPLVVNREEVKNGTGKSVIFIQGRRAIGIADGCNGLELYVLYIGFLFLSAIYCKKKRTILFGRDYSDIHLKQLSLFWVSMALFKRLPHCQLRPPLPV